jgi:hypothetical protein
MQEFRSYRIERLPSSSSQDGSSSRRDGRIQPRVSTWFQPWEPNTRGDAPSQGRKIKSESNMNVLCFDEMAEQEIHHRKIRVETLG